MGVVFKDVVAACEIVNCNGVEIVTKQGRSLSLNLQNRRGPGLKNFGTIAIHVEETVASRNVVEVVFRCSNLDNKDLFSKSDPFLRISRIVETGGSVPICKTEVVNNNLNPIWKPLCLSLQQFGSKGEVVTLAELGEYTRAVSLLEDLIKKKPSDPDAVRLLGEVKYEIQDYEGSAAAYKSSAMMSNSVDFEVLRGLTNALLSAKKPDEKGWRERMDDFEKKVSYYMRLTRNVSC